MMDRGFMEHYFDVTFNDAIGEIAGNDERYAELQSVADEAVHTLAGIVGKSNTALWEQCEHTINSLYTLSAATGKTGVSAWCGGSGKDAEII